MQSDYQLKPSASVSERRGPTSCGVRCFGLSCGCSSFEMCLHNEYDVDGTRDQDQIQDDIDKDFIGDVYVGDKN